MTSESDPFVSIRRGSLGGKEDLKPYEVTFTPPNNDYAKGTAKKKEFCCSCKCWSICCIVCVLVVGLTVLAGYLVIMNKFTGTASEEDAAEWDEMLTMSGNASVSGAMTSGDMAGVYKLVSFKNIDEYMLAIGVPSFAISFVKKMSEVRTVDPPEEPGGEWSVVVETDLGTRETKFRIGEEFTRGYGRNMDDGIMYVTVTTPEPHIIMFNAEERMKGWSFETNYTFSPLGIKCEAYFITKDVHLTKYYERTNREQWEAEKQQEEADNPFGDSVDDAFGHDDGDDDDGFGDFMEDDSDDDDRPLVEDPYEMEETRDESVDYRAPYNEDVADEQAVDTAWESDEYDDEYFSGDESDDQEYEEDEDEEDWNDW